MTALQGLLSTFGERAHRIVLPEPREDMSYVLVHQSPGATPELAARPDVTYVPQPGRGLSRSRNAALDAATGDHLFVLDDDVTFDLDAMERVAALAVRRGAAVAAYYHRWSDGRSTLKSQGTAAITRRTLGSVTSIDLSFRREPLVAAGVRFDEQFGLGARYPSCEEAVFLADCLDAGLSVWRFPVEVACHPTEHSGADFYSTPEAVEVRRAMLRRIFGRRAPLFIGAFWAKKLPRAARAGHAGTFTKAMLKP